RPAFPHRPSYSPGSPRDLPSVPTRRSSDLTPLCAIRNNVGACVQCNMDADCSGDAAHPFCFTDTHTCVECTPQHVDRCQRDSGGDRKSTRLNSSHEWISYAVFCLKKKKLVTNCKKISNRQRFIMESLVNFEHKRHNCADA